MAQLDSFLAVNFSQQTLGYLSQLTEYGKRNAYIRGAIIRDIQSGGNSVLLYRQMPGKKRFGAHQRRIRTSSQLRTLAQKRAESLSLSMAEYIAALVEQEWHRYRNRRV